MTALTAPSVRRAAKSAGAVAFVLKPADADKLTRLLGRLICPT